MPFTDTSVKWVTDEFRGAAVINGQPGSLLAAIRQFINGWGDLTPVSFTVTGGIATGYQKVYVSPTPPPSSIKSGSTHRNDNQYTRRPDLGNGQQQ